MQSLSIPRKKRILILVSRGGGGHKTAGEAIQKTLEDAYDVEVNAVLADILKPMDTLNVLTRGSFTGEDLYNFLLQRHQKKLLQGMIHCGKYVMNSCRIERIFDRYLSNLSERPDLIISPTPFINYGVACSAHRHDIPFIIVPTDLDGSTFLHGFPKTPTPFNLKLALAYDDPLIREATFQKTRFSDEQIFIMGFPIRPACTHKYSPEQEAQIRASFHLFESHHTITLVMGAVGGNLILNHVKSLTSLNPRAHGFNLQLNVCAGSNKTIACKVHDFLLSQGARCIGSHTFILPSGFVIHLRGYIPNLIDLMAVSDLIITKTGSCTVNEAIYLEKKVVLDNTERSTARYLAWERFNIPFVEKHRVGLAFSDSRQLPMLIPSLLKYPERGSSILERPPFEKNLRTLVKQLLTSSPL